MRSPRSSLPGLLQVLLRALGALRRVVPFSVPPLALLLFVAQVFVKLTEVLVHLAQMVLHVPQVPPHLAQTFTLHGTVSSLLPLSAWIVTLHAISSPPESTLDERVDARDVPEEVLRDIVAAGEVGGGVVAHQYIAVAVAPDQDLQWQV